MEVTELVMDKKGDIFKIKGITVAQINDIGGEHIPQEVGYYEFVTYYEDYVDPKDLEIQRLKEYIKKLEEPKVKKRYTRLTPEEWREVEDLIRIRSISNLDIAKEYGISDSSVSKRRKDMRLKGENV